MDAERNDFIRDIIDDDLRTGRHTRVATRFPPEPNGYLHIGHAKSICLNFGIAGDYVGTCNLRYDDTNPAKEDVEYVESIERDVRWLGFTPSQVLFSADYFPRMYELAERLVREGWAYVCDLDDEQIKQYRGTLSEPGRPSPFRDRTPADNLDRLRRMKAGEFPDGACTLRAKIDMASPNMKMRDPLLYRIRHAHHHRSGDAWCIYPMYDYAHPLEDAIEGITHSICTLEFENNRELYDWVLDHTGPWDPRPHQYEFARLQLDFTVMSKRKLLSLVQDGRVSGWDDPRMPTIAAMRRRGYSPEAIRAFADMIGVAKANSWVDIGKLEYCVRDDLNRNAPRVLGVLRPIEIELVGLPEGGAILDNAPYFPPDVGKPGSRPLSISDRIYIDRDDWRDEPPKDYQRLAPGRTVRLRYGYCITAGEVIARNAAGQVTKLGATLHPETLGGKNPSDGRKVSGVIHWVDAATAIPAEVRLYGRLFKTARPEDGGGDFLSQLDPSSLEVVTDARLEASLASAEVGSRWQLERVGYFAVDPDSRPGALVMNRIVTLRDSYAEARPSAAEAATPGEPAEKSTGKPSEKPSEKKDNPKAKSRPRSKSPGEYRAEARARDPELAAAYDQATARIGAESADLLTGDLATARLFLAAAQIAKPETAAKWIINELPRALGDSSREVGQVAASELGALLAAVDDGSLSTSRGKQVLTELVRTGTSFAELRAETAVPAVDLGAAIDAVIAANPDKVTQYKAGKTGLLGFFIGQVMKKAPGADAAAVNQALRERLG
ncbi:MAG TPA: glutamine--tRNA ligase/YqeY domain fusion protein [Kofleriaceae bacterium]|jgi:glutaminyl-tRNA synthetase|nr:glutamine--tRNA ligase/YqeY domain fusion protein [Kofleriaceae bacterium]